MPQLDLAEIEDLLASSLPDLDVQALDAVRQHFTSLGSEAETWVGRGTALSQQRSDCPYCGQSLGGSTLVDHYRSYFSEAYRAHKARISSAQSRLASALGGDALARFQRQVQHASERVQFWGRFVSVPAMTVNPDEVSSAWTACRDALLAALDLKTRSILDVVNLSPPSREAFGHFVAMSATVEQVSSSLLQVNSEIRRAKEQARHGNASTAETQLARLEATKRRHDPVTNEICRDYLEAKIRKLAAEEEKEQARRALDEYRERVFPTFQTAINKFLVRFNANFSVERLAATDPRGQPSSTYWLRVNDTAVPLAASETAPEPSFGSTLSGGDRATLALAFFFAQLDAEKGLKDCVVAIDDPASSLDDGRCVATAQEIRALAERAGQVITLSHSKKLLCEIWEYADQRTTCAIEIVNSGPDASTVGRWRVHEAAITEYDRRHERLRHFVGESKGDPREIATSLRPLLEAFLRIACVENFPPGKMLGHFINEARTLAEASKPLMPDDRLAELEKLKEYANRFHHDTSPSWQSEISNINETELGGYAKRILAFTGSIRF
jgi:wobble nucleotide-excising tRNase